MCPDYDFHRLCVWNRASGSRQTGHQLWKLQWSNNLPTLTHRQFFWRCSVSFVKFSYWSKFHVNIIAGSRFVIIFFYKGLTRYPEAEIPPSKFCPISGDWGELGIPNLVQKSLMKCFWMLQNGRVTAFTVSELSRENQQKGGSNKAKVFFKTITLDGPLWKTNFFQKEAAHVSILL